MSFKYFLFLLSFACFGVYVGSYVLGFRDT